MVRLILLAVLGIQLWTGAAVHAMQEQPAPPTPPAPAQDQYFSGNVTALDTNKITVTRTVLGAESTTRTFLVTPETRFEGKPKVKSRVTVRFVTVEETDRAVHVVVRPAGKK